MVFAVVQEIERGVEDAGHAVTSAVNFLFEPEHKALSALDR